MKFLRLLLTGPLLYWTLFLSFHGHASTEPHSESHAHSHSHPTYIPNGGQWNGDFQYKSQFGNLTLFAQNEGFTFVYSEDIPHDHEGEDHTGEVINKHAFSLNFIGSDEIDYYGADKKSGYHNYFLGNDPSKWVSKLPIYEGLKAENIYPGIHLHAYGGQGSFKYDFTVDPGADHKQIMLNYSGLDRVKFSPQALTLVTSIGEIVESIPVSYQIINGERVTVYCEYIDTEDGIGFLFPYGYDTAFPLVIDPVLVASTLSGTGSGGANFGHGASFDLAGNIYTHARSFNSEYPTDEGSFQELYGGGGTDVAVSKLTPDGSDLIYASFIGGSGGDLPISSIVNGNEELYVYGNTTSTDFPVSNNAFQQEAGGGLDIFITGLSADGSELVGSTLLGGSLDDANNMLAAAGYDNLRGEINLNLNGEVYLASCTMSPEFPITSGVFQEEKNEGQDAVVMKLSADLSELIWSTFVGSEGGDMAYGIKIKDDQTVYICGAVQGDGIEEFITTPGAYQEEFIGGQRDGFIVHLSENGEQLIESTFLGESGSDVCYFMDLDNNDDVWVYMLTQSAWEVTEGIWGNTPGGLCVHKLTEDLSELQVTSYLSNQGSGANGTPVAFMVDLCNNVYTSAYGANGFNATEDALFQNGGFFVGVFTPNMADVEYGTYYTEGHVDGGTSRFDKQGIVYQGVCSGGGFNTTDNAWATGQSTSWDIGVFKIDFEIESVNAVAGAAGFLTGCAPHTVEFQNFSSGESFDWSFGNGDTSTDFEPVVTYDEPGDYLVELVVFDPLSCNVRDTAYIPITVLPEVDFFTEFSYTVDCESGEVQITDASQGPEDIEYEWDMGDGTILTDENPTHIYDEPGSYTITLTLTSDACNQEMVEEQEVEYIPFIEADFNVQILDVCDSFTIGVANQSSGGATFTWDMGDGNSLVDETMFEYTYDEPGEYIIELIIQDELSCNLADTISETITLDAPPVLNPEISISQTGLCEKLNAIATVEPNGPVETSSWFIDGELVGSDITLNTIVDQPGEYTVSVVLIDPVCEREFVDEVTFTFYENLGFELPPSLFFCYYDESVLLNATVQYEDAIYDWNNGLSSDPVLEVTQEGDYTVEVLFNGCTESDETAVNFAQEFPLAFEGVICEGQPNTIFFEDQFEIVEEVFWDNGQTGFQVEIQESGYYPFTALDIFGCDQVDSLLAIPRDDDPNLQIPNVFTPNSDGFNDVFEITGDELVYFELQIFDRWGKLVHQTNEIYSTWDGMYSEGSGSDAGENTFMYILRYRDFCDLENNVKTGNITVLR